MAELLPGDPPGAERVAYHELPGWREAVAAASAVYGFPPAAYARAGLISNLRSGVPLYATPELAADAAALHVRYSRAAARPRWSDSSAASPRTSSDARRASCARASSSRRRRP